MKTLALLIALTSSAFAAELPTPEKNDTCAGNRNKATYLKELDLIVNKRDFTQIDELFALKAERRRVTPVTAHDDLAQKLVVGRTIGEVSMTAQHQRLIDGFFKIAMRRFNAAILVTEATIVARAVHAVVLKQRRIACREVVFVGEVSERR